MQVYASCKGPVFAGTKPTLFPLKREIRKILLIMRITAFLLLVATFQVSAKSWGQEKISLSYSNASLDQVFNSITTQTGINFFYRPEYVKGKVVTINVTNVDLKTVMEVCLKNQQLTYGVVGKTVIIRPIKKDNSTSSIEIIQNALPRIDVHGRVVNEKGEPVLASIIVKGKNQGTNTNEKGEFHLTNVDENTVLIISGVGIETTEIKVEGRTQVNIVAKITIRLLDEVQMIAYGTTTKRLNTGNVTSIKSSEIERQPVNNPLLAMAGKVPGMFIIQGTGLPGSGVTVQIRGQNSIANANNPLYIIDGVPYTNELLPSPVAIFGGGGLNNGNPLSYINAYDIESIEVLKDADATAIYGSRGANGVILITTKKSNRRSPKFGINMQQGYGKVARKIKLLNTAQYVQMRREAILNDNLMPDITDYDINGIWDTTRNVDWQKELLGAKANFTDIEGTFSDGNNNTEYLLSGNYHKEGSVFPGSFNDQKGALHLSINNVSTNQKFRLQFSSNFLADNNQLPGIDLTQTALQLAPNAPMLYNSDGTLNWAPVSAGSIGTWTNPESYLNNKFDRRVQNLISNLVVGYKVLQNLEFKSSFGYTYMHTDETRTTPSIYWDPYYWSYGNLLRSADYMNGNISSWIIEPLATYKSKLGKKGVMQLLAGATIQQSVSSSQSFSGSGYNSDLVLKNVASAATVTVTGTIDAKYKYDAVFGRIGYNWDDKYLINVTGRRDGSSRFGSENQFHNFGAVGVGWIFSKESFVEKKISLLSYGKIRGSYGTTGNDQIGDYKFMNLYQPSPTGVPYQGAVGFVPNALPNPYLQWEETKKFNAGIELGFLRDRILITGDYYQNRSSNQLVNIPLTSITGFTGVKGNLPATIQNMGWEISVNTSIFNGHNFTWQSSINVTIPKNKLVNFPDFSSSAYANSYIIGEPVTILRLYHALGVNPNTGIYWFMDSHGDPTNILNPATDKSTVVNLAPKYYGGFQNSFAYKDFELNILFQFVKQTGKLYLFQSLPGTFNNNEPQDILSRWQKNGDLADFQKFTTVTSNGVYDNYNTALNNSDLVYSDASFIRLKNISLSYSLPQVWQKKLYLKNGVISIKGQNLLTITHYKGLDPENQTATSVPPLRVITGGIQFSF